MKKNKFLKVFSSAMALSVILAGCSTSSNSGSKNAPKAKVEFKTSFDNGGSAVDGATLKYGILSAQPLTGLWNPVFSDKAEDQYVNQAVMGGTFSTDEEGRVLQDNANDPVKFHLDRDKKEVTLTIHDGAKWSNGEAFTTKDIVATYELMGNPKFTTNTRYNDSFELIEGMKEYHAGKAKTISGLQVKDDKTVVLKYTEVRPALLWGQGLVTDFLNAKQVEEASKDFAKFAEADLNKKPLSYGPYYITKVVNGESVLAEQNPHYYNKDKMKLKKIEFKTVAPAQASQVIKNGEVDVIDSVTPSVYEGAKDIKNGTFLGEASRYMSYVGFKLGKFDKEKGENVVDPNSKLADKNLRQAFLYAVDRDQINEKIFKGLRFTPTGSGMYPAAVGKLVNENATAAKKDVEKAKKLLDEAGYKDVDGDGLREDNKGNKLVFNFAFQGGNNYDQALSDTFIKSWKEVGLDVKLLDNKLMGKKEWDQRVLGDDPEIDLFLGAGHHGSDPSRQELFGRQSQFNYFRYTSDKIDEAFKEQRSDEMFDDNKLKEAYNKFDDLIADELPFFGLSWDTEITYVNKRVKHFNVEDFTKGRLSVENLELTKEAPEK